MLINLISAQYLRNLNNNLLNPICAFVFLSVSLSGTASIWAESGLTIVRECGDLSPLKWTSRLVKSSEDLALFTQEDFTAESEWTSSPEDVTGGYLVTECFGEPRPKSDHAVLHAYPPAPLTPRWSRPVLLLTGAGDNALRSMSFFAVALSRAGFQSYALSFAHRHGDNYQQAELVARTIGHILEETGSDAVDVVAYSKGTLPIRIYLSHHEGADFSESAPLYSSQGQRYAGDVHSLFMLGGPHAGLDTPFRWSASNLFALQDPPLDTPSAWVGYYPLGTANLLNRTSLESRSIYSLETSPYIGQAQMLSDLRELHELPGLNLSLGLYANQLDYLTTYTGGYGFYSESLGIDRAIADGGHTIATLNETGIDPNVELFLIAGGNPIMSVGGINQALYDSFWGDADAAERRRTWESLSEEWITQLFPWAGEAFRYDTPRLFAGTAFLGEISGPSDGLVFTDSALDASGLTRAGATVAESKLFEALNHAELVAASQLASEFYGDEETADILYDPNLSEKYAQEENQVIEYVIEKLKREGPLNLEPPMAGEEMAGEPVAGAMAGAMADAMAGEAVGGELAAGESEMISGGTEISGGRAGGTDGYQPETYESGSGRFSGSGCASNTRAPSSLFDLSIALLGLIFLMWRRRTLATSLNCSLINEGVTHHESVKYWRKS